MTPRSKEFYDRARERLEGARKNLDQGEHAIAVGAAYYAMLYGARAALSERDRHAKTHRGTWNLLRQTLVADASLPPDLVAGAMGRATTACSDLRASSRGRRDGSRMPPRSRRDAVDGARCLASASVPR